MVRPFLEVPGATIRALGATLGLEPAADPTNRDPRRLRGRLRSGVCGELEAIFPGASRRIAAAAEQAELAQRAIDRWLDEVWGSETGQDRARDPLRALPTQLVAAGLRRSVVESSPELGDRITEAMCRQVAEAVRDDESTPRTWAWPAGWRVELAANRLTLRRPATRPPMPSPADDRTNRRCSSPPLRAATPRT